jgi:hypothetical protein
MSSSIDMDVLPDDKPYYTEHRPVLCGSFNVTNVEIPFFKDFFLLGALSTSLIW